MTNDGMTSEEMVRLRLRSCRFRILSRFAGSFFTRHLHSGPLAGSERSSGRLLPAGLALVLGALGLMSQGCSQPRPESGEDLSAVGSGSAASVSRGSVEPRAEPQRPVALSDQAPLLLEEEPAGTAGATPAADNSRCLVCHMNFQKEELALTHARADVGCAKCHGASDHHIADESWASGGNGTAPDIMYPAAQINPGCLHCHPREKIDAEAHKELWAGTATQQLCTDCHGAHRLPQRRCKWK